MLNPNYFKCIIWVKKMLKSLIVGVAVFYNLFLIFQELINVTFNP